MEQLKRLPLGRQLVLGAGILLLIDTIFHWQSVSTPIGSIGQSAWHGFWGVVMGLLLIVLLAWTVARVFEVELPVAAPDGMTSLALSIAVLVCAVIKTISDSYVAWPAYVGIILAAVMTYGAYLIFKQAGESLPRVRTGGAGGAETAAPPAAPEAPASPSPPSASSTEESEDSGPAPG